MKLMTEPVSKQSRLQPVARTAKEWIDALSSGACNQETFSHGVGDLLQTAPDAGWDLLALIDQYYRLGKISAEAYSALNTHIQSLVMGIGMGRGSDGKAPMLRIPDAAPMAPGGPGSAPPAAPKSSPPEVPNPITAPVAAPFPPSTTTLPFASIPAPRRTPTARPASTLTAVPADSGSAVADAAAADLAIQGRPTRTLAVGDLLRGRYRVESVLGQGGMGTVFSAIDQYRLDRSPTEQRVAIKVLHTAVIKRPRLFAELRREFQHLQSLSHPNIVRVHEFDRDGDLAFFTMEYLSGVLLSRVLSVRESSALNRAHALNIVKAVGQAVAHAHAHGVVHGDLNPANIFITDDGEVRVLDFGASHQVHGGPTIAEFGGDQHVAVATLIYASCQLLEGAQADARDDVYALACIAYVLLTGQYPFKEHTALAARTLRMSPARPRGLSGRQWAALREGLRFDRERRPSDVLAWLKRLDLRGAAAHLPALPALMTVGTPRKRNGSWGWAAAWGFLLLAAGWLIATNLDAVQDTGQEWVGRVQALFAGTAVGDWWDKDHGNGGTAVPAIEPEAEPPRREVASHRDAATRRDSVPRSMPATESATQAPRVAANPPRAFSAPPPALTPGATGPLLAPGAPASTAAQASNAGQASSPRNVHVELAADSVEVAPDEDMVRIVVHRNRSLRGDAAFTWWTESGTAKPGRDFLPIKAQIEHLEDGKSAISLVVPILPDPTRHEPRSFYVVIDQADETAAVGPRTLTMVTIPGEE